MGFNFDNLPEYSTVSESEYALRGSTDSASDGVISAECDNFGTRYFAVTDSQFEISLDLAQGENNVTLKHLDGGYNDNEELVPGENVYDETELTFNLESSSGDDDESTTTLDDGREVNKTGLYGETRSSPIEAVIPEGRTVTSIKVNHGDALDGFDVCFDDGSSVQFGNTDSIKSEFALQDDEKLVGFQVHSGAWVDGIAFTTNQRVSDNYGGEGGSFHEITIPENATLVGFYGQMGSWVYRVGAYYV